MKPIAAYVRVSTTDQHPEAQLAELRDYGRRRGVELREYVDHGISGRKDRRPALDQMMRAARPVRRVPVLRSSSRAISASRGRELEDVRPVKIDAGLWAGAGPRNSSR